MCFRIEWDKSSVTWFLSGQTSDKICQYKKSQLKLFILLKWDDELIVMQSVLWSSFEIFFSGQMENSGRQQVPVKFLLNSETKKQQRF